MIDISGENVVLVGALLLFVAVMAGKVAYRFGAPALLLFLGVGMLFGLDFISYRSVDMTQFVGMIALCIILFTGGMDTKFSEIKPIIGPGVVLATAGVGMTPTTSTTAMTVIGDILVVQTMKETGFTIEDYSKRHHGGYLGEKSRSLCVK